MKNKIKKLGVICEDLGPNQLSYQLITSGNKLVQETDDYDICLFYRNFLPFVKNPNFGTFTAYEGFTYNGIMIATDLHSANAIVKWPGPNRNKIYFYVQNLEYLRLRGSMPYEQMAKVYLNPKINLIARSEEHKDIIESVWKKCVGVVENADLTKMVEVIEWK